MKSNGLYSCLLRRQREQLDQNQVFCFFFLDAERPTLDTTLQNKKPFPLKDTRGIGIGIDRRFQTLNSFRRSVDKSDKLMISVNRYVMSVGIFDQKD